MPFLQIVLQPTLATMQFVLYMGAVDPRVEFFSQFFYDDGVLIVLKTHKLKTHLQFILHRPRLDCKKIMMYEKTIL